jgi:hypothetical protein
VRSPKPARSASACWLNPAASLQFSLTPVGEPIPHEQIVRWLEVAAECLGPRR